MLLPPRVSHDQAEEIAAAHYGVSAAAERLAAEHDDTFRLVTADGTTRLLKIAQIAPGTLPDAGASPAAASFQTAVLLHLARAAPALPVQRVIGTLDGSPELWLDGRVARMTSYLEGPTLGSRPASAALRRDIGGTLARLDQALRAFAHPGADRTHLWDLQNFHQLRPLLDQLPGEPADRDQRAALVSCLDLFEARVRPRLADPETRRQVIHTDFHGDNLLVDADRVTGVLDFGDSLAGPVAMDVGVAACYQFGAADGTDPLTPALDVIAGYHAVDPLGPDDPALIGDKAELASVAAASPLLGEVRGAGLYLGADVVDPATGDPSGARAAAIVNGMRDRRVLISATGPHGHTLKIRPPLPFSRANANHLLEVLADTLANLT